MCRRFSSVCLTVYSHCMSRSQVCLSASKKHCGLKPDLCRRTGTCFSQMLKRCRRVHICHIDFHSCDSCVCVSLLALIVITKLLKDRSSSSFCKLPNSFSCFTASYRTRGGGILIHMEPRKQRQTDIRFVI